MASPSWRIPRSHNTLGPNGVGFAIAVSFVLSALAAIAGAFGVGRIAVTAKGEIVRRGLAACIIGTLPGLVFVSHLLLTAAIVPRGTPLRPYDLLSLGPAMLWVLAGPCFFLWSAVVARPGRIPRLVEVLRVILFLGWVASSFLAVVAASEV